MIVTHNLVAMNAQRQFNIAGISKKKSTEKLSSGYKINRAADDAAGLTISETIRSKIRALNQGSYNTQDGISWIQVADGAMAEAHDMMHRLKELAIHAANGTLTDADRYAIDRETQGILDEIHRIDMSTEFNTKDVFLHGDVMFNVHGEPGDLEVYDAVIDENGVTFGGFLFHGERVRFDDSRLQPSDIVRMENGKQVFNVPGDSKKATVTFKNDKGEKFELEIEDGAIVPEAKRRLEVTAKPSDGIIIDGHIIPWSNTIDEDGLPVDPNNPRRGTFSVPYGNSVLDISIGNGCSIRNAQEFCDAITNACKMEENGGVGYTWITELDGVYSRNALASDPAVFEGDATRVGSSTTKRNVDNVMAYDTNTDVYNKYFTDGKMEYKLVAELVETDENKLVHDDLANGTATAIQKGMDVVNQDIKLYLVGADGTKIEGTEVLMSKLTPNNVMPEDWSKGMGLTDGDSCKEHSWPYDTSDDFSDKIFVYSDPSNKTDIKMEFKLSEVASADSIAYNVKLVNTGRIQDYNKGLNGTTYSQNFDSEFSDVMSKTSESDGGSKKVSIVNDGKSGNYYATYDANISLGRDFDKENEDLAVINGTNTTQEGTIIYNSDSQTISFDVRGNNVNKGSTDYSETRADNNINVNFLNFSASTTQEEIDFVNSIKSKAQTIIDKKAAYVLSGKDDGKNIVSDTVGTERITLTDVNVFDKNDIAESGRSYGYDYNYNDLMKTFNGNLTSSDVDANSATNDIGEKITVKLVDTGAYNANITGADNKYIKLSDDYGAYEKGSYINVKELAGAIDEVLGKINDGLSKGQVYVHNALDSTKVEYIKELDYEANVRSAVATAKSKANTDTKKYVVNSDGDIVEESELKGSLSSDYSDELRYIKDALSNNIYGSTNDDGVFVPLTGDVLKDAVLGSLNDLAKSVSDEALYLVYDEIYELSSDKFNADPEGKLNVDSLLPAASVSSWADGLAQSKINNQEFTINNDKFLNKLECTDELKKILAGNESLKVTGSFTLGTVAGKLLDDEVVNPKIEKSIVKLGTEGSPEIEEDNLKDIFKNNYSTAAAGITGPVADILNKYLNTNLETNWDTIKSNLKQVEGRVTLGNLTSILNEEVVDALTDGNTNVLVAQYGDVDADSIADPITRKRQADGSYTYSSNVMGDSNSNDLKYVAADAVDYASKAMVDIANSSTFTLKTEGYATTKMSTESDPGEVAYARYDSDLEIEFMGSLDIQHSNDYDDFTTIQQFCFNTAVMKITNVDLTTQEKAKKAIAKIDYATDYISEKRSDLGATQNRLEHTYNNNRNKEENLTAAESRIRDTDMALEMMNNVKLNILEQAVTSMMAQANQSTQGVLSLLQ